MFLKIIYIVIIAFLINCASSSAGIATSNIPIVNRKYKILAPVEEMRTWYTFDIAVMGIPLKTPPIEEMMRSLKESQNADALVNITFWMDRSVYFFITRHRLSIKAEAVKFEEEIQDVKKPR